MIHTKVQSVADDNIMYLQKKRVYYKSEWKEYVKTFLISTILYIVGTIRVPSIC